jgi:hypothetical protein
MMDSEDLVGLRFGCLVVIRRFEDYTWSGGTSREPRWICQCDCGNATVKRRSSHLRRRPPARCRKCPRAPSVVPCGSCQRFRRNYSDGLCQPCYRKRLREL